MEAQKEIDTRGLNCPLPILKAKKALADMSSGDVLKVVATDPGSVRDFQAFARQTGNELLEQTSANDEFVHYLRAQVAAPSERQRAQVRPELRAQLRVLEGELDVGLQEAFLAAAVVALALVAVGEHLLVLQQAGDAVGELDLAADAARLVRDLVRRRAA